MAPAAPLAYTPGRWRTGRLRLGGRAPDVLGRTIAGKFRIESYLGGGAMGAVYKARQLALDKDVAIKVLHGEHAGDATFAARFQREAKAACRLDHPNSMRVIDFGAGAGRAALHRDGVPRRARPPRRPPRGLAALARARVADILSQVLAALAVAHEMGIVHRDLKPENIMAPARHGRRGRARATS